MVEILLLWWFLLMASERAQLTAMISAGPEAAGYQTGCLNSCDAEWVLLF
jgi:hypothetical protein